jgi:coenzyme F420-reducing hydrogenase alpha subunit
MTIAFRNRIDVAVSLAAGSIAAVEILPRTRPPLERLFAGKPASSLLAALPRLFSLCSGAHQVAFLSAIESARGQEASEEVKYWRIVAVLAERLAELLRGLVLGPLALEGVSTEAARSVMQASAVLCHDGADRQSRREALSTIRAALTALGITNEPAQNGAHHLMALDRDALSHSVVEQSFLSVADDREVVRRLASERASFADAPDLHGRVPETGVWARRAISEPAPAKMAGPAKRLRARIVEVTELCSWLEACEAGADRAPMERGVVEGYSLGAGKGAAAVECARGRLYHVVELDDDDRIIRFDFLAPTEWNFHARGPMVRVLQGAAVAAGRTGQDAVRAMIGSFDPCVGFNLTFRGAADA